MLELDSVETGEPSVKFGEHVKITTEETCRISSAWLDVAEGSTVVKKCSLSCCPTCAVGTLTRNAGTGPREGEACSLGLDGVREFTLDAACDGYRLVRTALLLGDSDDFRAPLVCIKDFGGQF